MESSILLGSLFIILLGCVPLFFGRKLFWFFVGLSGFLLGLVVGPLLARDGGWPIQILLALLVGVLFAVLAIYLQKPMASIAGFILGGSLFTLLYIVLRAGANLNNLIYLGAPGGETWIVFLIGGLGFAVLVWITYEWALIVMTALSGGLMVASGIGAIMALLSPMWPSLLNLALWVGLTALGIWVQAQALTKRTVMVGRPNTMPPQPPARP